MARVANFEYDVENDRYTYTSDTLFEIFGLDRSKYPQFTSELFWTLVHPDDLDSVRKAKRQPEHLYNSTLEYRIIRPDGKIVYIHRQREIIRNAHGTPIKTIGTLQDITDRKLSELTLQRSEERFRSLVQNGNDLLSIIDKEGNYIFVGTNLVRHLHFGRSAEELVGKNAFDFIHPDDVEKAAKALQEIKEKDSITIGPFRFQNAQGEWRWIITTVSNHLAHPAIAGLVTNSRDVTEQKLKDDALKRSEKRFKALVQNGSDLIVIIDENKHFTYLSDNAPAIIGYEAEELVGKNVLLYVHPEDQEKVAQRIQKVFENNVENPGIEHRFLHKNGNWIHLESRGSNHQDNDHIGGLLVNVRNITERVRLQKRLYKEQQSKQKEIMTAVIKTQEAERTQLGLELHDNVNQILTTVKLYNEMDLCPIKNSWSKPPNIHKTASMRSEAFPKGFPLLL
jgi:PAS domain S-box-containing protein